MAMFVAEVGCVFMGFILYLSGVQGKTNSICALKGSTVDLTCSAQHHTSNMKWYTEHLNGSTFSTKELNVDGRRVTYNMSKETHPTLKIKNVSESDERMYCCKEETDQQSCLANGIQLQVADLQVKVFPAPEAQTVTLMCSSSCPLSENPAAYIWFKNQGFLYQDWSPWYQHLVSGDTAVTYFCAIQGHEHLRAPPVSVDSVTSTCFSVTYAGGRMCSYKRTPADGPCSITYPREVHVQKSPAAEKDHVPLSCNTSCALTDHHIVLRRKENSNGNRWEEKQPITVPTTSTDTFSCAVKGLEDLHSPEVCSADGNCMRVNYVSKRICTLEGSTVNITSEYSPPAYQQLKPRLWYKMKRSDKEDAQELPEAAGRVIYHDNMKNRHILTITNLKKDDSAEYTLRLKKGWKESDSPGVTLVVTGLRVVFSPSAVVTEGQRVTLTCSTSCSLTHYTNYTWYLNSRPLKNTENQDKELVLDPVSSQHAGNYSCAVQSPLSTSSQEKSLAVHTVTRAWVTAVGVCAALLVVISLAVVLWISKKKTSSQPPRTEMYMEQRDPVPVYDEISAQPTEQDDVHYSRVHFPENSRDHLYTTVQPHPRQEQDHEPYSLIKFTPNKNKP